MYTCGDMNTTMLKHACSIGQPALHLTAHLGTSHSAPFWLFERSQQVDAILRTRDLHHRYWTEFTKVQPSC